MKYLDTEWFTGGTGGVGIVFVEGEPGDEDLDPGQRGAYIGVASGISEKGDIRRILDYGVLDYCP